MIKQLHVIETNRLLLRSFTEKDIEALYLLLQDKDVNTFLPWFPAKNIEDAKEFFEEKIVCEDSQSDFYAICLKNIDVPIGYITVKQDDSHDFGYALRKEFWHQGIVTEAGAAVIAKLQKDHVPYITATHDVQNPRSGGVMIHLGMKYQYSYEEEWQPKGYKVIFRMYQLNLDGQQNRVYRKYWDLYQNHFIETEP